VLVCLCPLDSITLGILFGESYYNWHLNACQLDRILSVTPLEDLQIKALLIFGDESIITYPDASDMLALPAREELLQLTTPGIGSEIEIEDPTPFPL
jgi:hypothetical protein